LVKGKVVAKYEEVGKGVVRRRERKKLALFIDGTGLDRATRRLSRKVDLAALVRGVTSGLNPTIARYYTLIPYEDDSRQRSFLDAVSRANLNVVVKRLPPKGVTRQVSIDVELASDLIAFGLGVSDFSDLSDDKLEMVPAPHSSPIINRGMTLSSPQKSRELKEKKEAEEKALITQNQVDSEPNGNKLDAKDSDEARMVVVVCPSRELSYPIALLRNLGIDTTAADFGQFGGNDLIKSAAKWIDLSDSETIWR
jgi:hypothetical protein